MNQEETRYDPETGKLFVPLDIRKDVIEPLKEVRSLAQSTDARLGTHVADHAAAIAAKAARRAKLIRMGKVAIGGLGGAVSLVLTLHQAGVL